MQGILLIHSESSFPQENFLCFHDALYFRSGRLSQWRRQDFEREGRFLKNPGFSVSLKYFLLYIVVQVNLGNREAVTVIFFARGHSLQYTETDTSTFPLLSLKKYYFELIDEGGATHQT
jgi:hypothetical protein